MLIDLKTDYQLQHAPIVRKRSDESNQMIEQKLLHFGEIPLFYSIACMPESETIINFNRRLLTSPLFINANRYLVLTHQQIYLKFNQLAQISIETHVYHMTLSSNEHFKIDCIFLLFD